MLFEDHTAYRTDGRLYCRKLDQHFRAVTAVFYHALGRFHMPDYPGHSVEYRLCMFRGMDMTMVVMMPAVGVDVGMRILVAMLICVDMFMHVFMGMLMIVDMLVIIRHICLRICYNVINLYSC